jgi:quercetin dioxygenase-like cupin family protein
MVAPEDPKLSAEENEQIHAERFAAMGASQCRLDTSRHPAMHTTRTVDYIILLSGEVTMLLDKGEVHMKPLDVVIQRGTNHGWVNKGKEPALLVAVLVDAKPL